MEFIAIDVETANADVASICQIGVARFINRELNEEWKTYLNPENYFDGINISIHGIDESVVANAPTFCDIADTLNRFLDNRVVVTHTHFDRLAVHQAAVKSAVFPPRCTWLDSARVARRAWKEFARSGYGLANVSKVLGYEFKHHDALEDAKAAGNILLAAMEQSGLDLEAWLRRVSQPISARKCASKSGSSAPIKREGNAEGPFHGEVLVFTGALKIPRREAADMAGSIGFRVASNVNKETTILVVGDQDIKHLAGHTKSTKHRKAEELGLKGQPIRILRESDFREIVELSN